MSTVKSIMTATKVLGAVVSVVNYNTGHASKPQVVRSAAALFNITRKEAEALTGDAILTYSLRTIKNVVPSEFSALGDALCGLCRMMVTSATQKRLVISYEFLRYIFGKALSDPTILEHLRKDPDFSEGDITPEDVISMLYTASPALADAIESLEDSPYNNPQSEEFTQLTQEYESSKEAGDDDKN